MQKQIASSATIVLLFAVIAAVATTSLQHASALMASSTADAASASTSTPALPPLTLVHPKGNGFIDYCSDGSKTIELPGDPAIDDHFSDANTPTPKCNGMKWLYSTRYPAYDTPSGHLDIGDYTQQDDGTYLIHLPPQTYTDATSTSQWPDRYIVMSTDPNAAPTAPSSPAPAQQQPPPAATTTTDTSTTTTESASTTPPDTSSATTPSSSSTPSDTGSDATTTQ